MFLRSVLNEKNAQLSPLPLYAHLVISSTSSNQYLPPFLLPFSFPTSPHQTSAISLNRRIVLLVAAAAGVLRDTPQRTRQPTSTRMPHIPIIDILTHPIPPSSRFPIPTTATKKQTDKRPHLRNRPRPTRDRLLAASTIPDTDAVSLDRRFAAEGASVAGVLADLHLLNLFAEGGAVSVFFRGDWY